MGGVRLWLQRDHLLLAWDRGRTNHFGFTIAWASGQVVVVEACTNLAHPVWSALQTNVLTAGSLYFSDPQWTNYPSRFYRLRWLSPQDQYTFTTNTGAITITGYTGPGGAVTIPGTINGLPVTSIGGSAFGNNINLTSVTIPDGVTNIGGYAFFFCTNLSSVTLPNSVTGIGSYAFKSCTSLTSVPIPTSVTNIGDGAFFFCTSLTSITIPNSVNFIGDNAFSYCSSLTAIIVDTNNPAYIGIAGVLFNKSQTTLIQYPAAKAGTSYTIPNSVTNIGNYALHECTSLTNVTIGSSVTSIGVNAFYSCTSLSSIVIPIGVTTIGVGAFGGCTSLNSVTIGNSVTIIGAGVFDSCTNLTSVTIGNNVTNIGDSAFFFCTSLTSITIPNSVNFIGDSAFALCASLSKVYFQGNAPFVDYQHSPDAFYGDPTTVYYLPGTTGWGGFSANTGLLPVLWKPQMQTSDASFGVRTNRFGFNITWTSGQVVVVEACTNLPHPTWFPLQTNTLTSDSLYFSDAQWTNYPARLYRLRSP